MQKGEAITWILGPQQKLNMSAEVPYKQLFLLSFHYYKLLLFGEELICSVYISLQCYLHSEYKITGQQVMSSV